MRRIPQETAHHRPTFIANQVQKSFLRLLPMGLCVGNQSRPFLCEGDDPRSLIASGTTSDESIPLEGRKRPRDAGSIHHHVPPEGRHRNLWGAFDDAQQRVLCNV
jgi:hypothetical protein